MNNPIIVPNTLVLGVYIANENHYGQFVVKGGCIKKPITFLLIALIIFLSVNVHTEMSFFNSKIKYNREIPASHDLVGGSTRIHIEAIRERDLREQRHNEVNMLDNLVKYAENAVGSYEKGNYKEAYKNDLIVKMIHTRLFCSIEEEELLKANIIDIWNELLPEIEYDTSKSLNLETSLTADEIKSYCVQIKYKYDLFNKDIYNIKEIHCILGGNCDKVIKRYHFLYL